MKITIVTATINAVRGGRVEMLERCVKSVASLRTPHEHLIYDGASTDGTVEILRELEKKYPSVRVVSEPDTGIYNALNKGWRNSDGDWVYFIGDDDYLQYPSTFDEVLQSPGVDETDVIISPVWMEDGGHLYPFIRPYRCILAGMPYSHQGVIMRSRVIENLGGFDETFKITADYDLCLRARLAGYRHLNVWKQYAFFSRGGLSQQLDRTKLDMARVVKKNLGLDEKEFQLLASKRLLPLRVVVPFLLSSDVDLRAGARHAIKRRIANLLGFLSSNGNPKINF